MSLPQRGLYYEITNRGRIRVELSEEEIKHKIKFSEEKEINLSKNELQSSKNFGIILFP